MRNKVNRHLIQLDIASRYNELARITCQHLYFNKTKTFACIEIVPSAETREILKQYHLIFRPDVQGFSLGYGSMPEYVPLEQLEKPLQLTFWMRTVDSYFLNYTNIPFEIDDSIYCFSNRMEYKEDSEKRNLSKFEKVTGDDRVYTTGPMFKYEFAAPLLFESELTVENALGEVVFQQTLPEDSTYCNVSLMDEDAGRYRLCMDGIEEEVFYMVPNTINARYFGVIDLYLDRNDRSIYSFYSEQGKVIRQDYTLTFESRALKWRYVVIDQAGGGHTDHQAYDARKMRREDGAKFEAPTEVTLDTGTKAIVISTSEPIALYENQEERFKLRTRKGKNRVEWTTDLPCASAKSAFKSDPEKKEEIFSELVVFL